MAKFARAIALAVAALASVPLSSGSECQTLCAGKLKSGEATSCIVIDAREGFCSFMDPDVTFSSEGSEIKNVNEGCIKCLGTGTMLRGTSKLRGKTEEDYAAYKKGCGGNGDDILDLTLSPLACYDDGEGGNIVVIWPVNDDGEGGNGIVIWPANVFAITGGLGNEIGHVLKEGSERSKANYVMIIDLTKK